MKRAILVAVVLLAAACGNSDDDDDAAPATTEGSGSSTTEGEDDGSDRDTFVAIEGVPGVTDEEIGYAVIGTRANNPLGTCILDCFLDGINAYFAFRNDEGGIYGRQLVVNQELDDELGQNQVRSLEVVSNDESFGAFSATLVASGWGDLDAAGIPTYVWNIHSTEFAGRTSVWGNIGAICGNCTGRVVPYAAQLAGATRIATLGYGSTESSRECTNAAAASVELYAGDTGQEVAYVNDELAFGLPNGIGPEVTQMRDAGVEFVSTCMDLNGMKTLAQELQRQGMDDVVLLHPNTYNQPFVAAAGGIFDGDMVGVQFRPFESTSNEMLANFQEWMDRTGAELSEPAMVGWIDADLAFEGLLAAGPDFDRQAVIDATNQFTEYSAGGLVNPIDWTRQHNPATEDDRGNGGDQECSALVRVVDGAFETVAPPATPFVCWPEEDRAFTEPEPTSFG